MLGGLFGLSFLFAPELTAGNYGLALRDPGSVLMSRFFGSAMLMYAAGVFGLAVLQDGAAQRRAARALAVVTAAGLVLSVMGVLAGTVNAVGWSSVAIYGVFTLGWLLNAR